MEKNSDGDRDEIQGSVTTADCDGLVQDLGLLSLSDEQPNDGPQDEVGQRVQTSIYTSGRIQDRFDEGQP
eukprot:7938157-Pyramimonas_sp.AAC.1